jgi:hypothetical protein
MLATPETRDHENTSRESVEVVTGRRQWSTTAGYQAWRPNAGCNSGYGSRQAQRLTAISTIVTGTGVGAEEVWGDPLGELGWRYGRSQNTINTAQVTPFLSQNVKLRPAWRRPP